MGNVASRDFGVSPIWASSIFDNCFLNVSLAFLPTLWKCSAKLLELPFNPS